VNRRATVVGAAGFVGHRLAARLAAGGWDVWAPAKHDAALLNRDLGLVFYCAGLTADYDQRPFDTVEAHASLVADILRAGRFERIVYCSSTRLYDGLASAEVTEELSSGDRLEKELKQLEVGAKAGSDEHLLELKRKMGMLPPAAPAPGKQLADGEPAKQLGAGAVGDEAPVHEAELLEEFEELERKE
jgi:nucleoside-diphosphate-sugar epimerase